MLVKYMLPLFLVATPASCTNACHTSPSPPGTSTCDDNPFVTNTIGDIALVQIDVDPVTKECGACFGSLHRSAVFNPKSGYWSDGFTRMPKDCTFADGPYQTLPDNSCCVAFGTKVPTLISSGIAGKAAAACYQQLLGASGVTLTKK